jgi:hypothetical protein
VLRAAGETETTQENIQDWLQLDEGDPAFQLVTEKEIAAVIFLWSRDSSVGIATGYGLDDRGVGVRVPTGSRIFSSPRRPNQFCCSPSLLSNEYRG